MFDKIFSVECIVGVIIVIIILWIIYVYFGKINIEKYENVDIQDNMNIDMDTNLIGTETINKAPSSNPQIDDQIQQERNINIIKQNTNVLPNPQPSNNFGSSKIEIEKQFRMKPAVSANIDCYPKDTVTAQELLPKEDPNNLWSTMNPQNQGHLADKNFLESGHHYGINTVGSSLRNANLQIRSDPPIPQKVTVPWMQSTIDPDVNRRMLEIGSS